MNKITSKADCDTLIDMADSELKDMEFKKLQQERQYENVTIESKCIDEEIESVGSEISGV